MDHATHNKGVSFIGSTRHFYQPQALRTLDEISTDIVAVEKEAEGVLDELLMGKS